jgi:predicted SPOUT superfamily RNA methylase MTH1
VTQGQRGFRLSIAVPSSLVSELPHLREKTVVVGQVARASAIYRVDAVYIYRDDPDESRLIRLLLSYIETPQYLRRRQFKMMDELRYVGVLPPLRTPHHPLEKRADRLRVGEFREGVVLSEEAGEFQVDIGVEKPLIATGRAPSLGGRATVMVSDVSPVLSGRFVRRREIDLYWGYEVHVMRGGIEKLDSIGNFDLKIATSRHAQTIKQLEPEICSRLVDARKVLVAFGSPRKGLKGLSSERGVVLDRVFDFTVNTIPSQGTETVRTEEAISATLALLNALEPEGRS